MGLVCNSMWQNKSCDFGLCQCSRCPVQSPARLPPDPTWHLPYVPSLPPSVTVLPHQPPLLYLWGTALKGKDPCPRWKTSNAPLPTLQVKIDTLKRVHIEYRNGWLSAIKVKTVNYKSALLNYMAIESSSSVSPLSPEAAGGITVSGGPTAVCQGNSEDN